MKRTFTGCFLAVLCCAGSQAAPPLLPPPVGRLYHGFYYDRPTGADGDSTEHNVTPADVARYEETIGKKTAWVFFSDNWFESRHFPREMCDWIHGLGKVPYVRLMLRSSLEQARPEKIFSLTNISQGQFDDDLRAWAKGAAAFGSPILIEWGTEPNGSWFSWNGKWNGGAGVGPERYIAAWRHIVDLMRAEGAHNLQWVWHVNWFDEPQAKWNHFENYYPGEDYCDWIGLSAYGPLTPRTRDGTENLRFKMRRAYPRLQKLAPSKPILLSEFGCDLHNRHVRADVWAKAALDDLFSGRWPAVIGFCWWNETWENDDNKSHDTDMNILHDLRLTNVFKEEFKQHGDRVQEWMVIEPGR